jgi:hypothetical protein
MGADHRTERQLSYFICHSNTFQGFNQLAATLAIGLWDTLLELGLRETKFAECIKVEKQNPE